VSGNFTTIKRADPHQTSHLIWEYLPLTEKALLEEHEVWSHEYAALDWWRFRIEPESFHSEFSIAPVGAMRAVRIVHGRATQETKRAPRLEAFCVSLIERGASQAAQPESDDPAIGNANGGLIFAGEPGPRFAASGGSVRFNLWVPARLLHERLEVLLNGQKVESLVFQPLIDQTRGAGATIRRLLSFLFIELAHSDSLLANKIVTPSIEETLTLCLLLGVSHNYTKRLLEQRVAAAPGNVRRAEEFMRVNASAPLTITEIAHAAECSVRALQMAFRRFRGTTPMSALQRIRLEEARAQMLRAGRTQSLARIAADYGFSNPSRFAQLFRRTYGAYPSKFQGTRRGPQRSSE
jgi:AraC-like DNA-binding protein